MNSSSRKSTTTWSTPDEATRASCSSSAALDARSSSPLTVITLALPSLLTSTRKWLCTCSREPTDLLGHVPPCLATANRGKCRNDGNCRVPRNRHDGDADG